MKILAIEKEVEGVNWKNEGETLKSEAQKVYQLYLKGYIREIYFNQHHNALIMLECDSIEKALSILGELPLVEKKLIEFELMELKPYTGYSRLMSFE